jgi:hypothetical protein
MNYVKVIATEIAFDRNAREYKRVTLQSMDNAQYVDPETGEVSAVLAPATTVRAIGYKVPYLFEESDASAIPDWMWNAKPGMVVQGAIVRRQVAPYDLGGVTREYATVFVAGNPSNATEFERAINASFEKSGHTLADQLHPIPTGGIKERRAIRVI